MSDDEEIILSELSDQELVLQMHDDLYDGLNEEIVEDNAVHKTCRVSASSVESESAGKGPWFRVWAIEPSN